MSAGERAAAVPASDDPSDAASDGQPAGVPDGTTTWIDCAATVDAYLTRANWRVAENANLGFGHVGLMGNAAGKVIANYWLDRVYAPAAARAHRDGDLHIHNLGALAGYCAGWSLRQLLDEGFNGGPGRIASRPPRHLREALAQAANFLGVLQSEWAGAQAFASFDTYLAPYLFADRLGDAALKRELRHFVYDLNVPARWGQSPFTNVTLDIAVPQDLAGQPPTRGGRHLFDGVADADLLAEARRRDPAVRALTDLTYRHFAPECARIVIALYAVLSDGDGMGQPFTFPIPTVNVTEDFPWDGPVSDAIFDNASRMGSTYFQNFLGSRWIVDADGTRRPNPDAFDPGAVRSMCCRLQLDLRALERRGDGLFGSGEMTGSLGVVTLNMARLGYLCRDDEGALAGRLDGLLDLAFDTLERKRAKLTALYEAGLFPYTRRYLPSFRNHFNTVGVNGMNEMLRNLTRGRLDLTRREGIDRCLAVLDRIRERLRGYQQQSGHLYNLEATPAEGTSYRLARLDRERFPDILQAGTPPGIYYTNSSQLPVGLTDDPFEALALQNDLQGRYTGGTVLHLYMSERLSSGDAARMLVRRVLERWQLPSITITPVFSVCPTHGAIGGEVAACPTCGAKTQTWTRVVGYYRPVESFNVGKQGEHRERRFFVERKALADAAP
ncbi:MAG: ribonucleoside triphosphate reductase [Alphaproteobacteria bacterium]